MRCSAWPNIANHPRDTHHPACGSGLGIQEFRGWGFWFSIWHCRFWAYGLEGLLLGVWDLGWVWGLGFKKLWGFRWVLGVC